MAGALAVGGLLHALPVQAIEFGDGELQGSLDATISHGLTFRVGKHDPEYSEDINGNDGDLNYDRGLVSNTSKFTTDLDIQYGNFGAFARASGFIDFENENGRRPHVDLSEAAKDRVGKNLELLDAYVTGAFDADDATFDLRLGKHVLNWGESTFIQNGINAVNPFDVSKLRVPGAELREALVAVPLLSTVVEMPLNFSLEGFYQLDWDKTEIDPLGTYFSTTDYVGPGATRAYLNDPALNMALEAVPGGPRLGDTLEDGSDFLVVARGDDRNPRDAGQWGVALRYLAEGLNNTEFGFYFMNYHSRLPTVRAHTGTVQGAFAGLGAMQARGAAIGQALAQSIAQTLVPTLVPKYLAQGLSQADAVAAARMEATPIAAAQAAALAPRLAVPYGVNAYVRTGNYFIEYPEDIQLYGVSFNTQLGAPGWALQGEYSFRQDVPLQILEAALISSGLAPFTDCLAHGANAPACIQGSLSRFDADVDGYIRRRMSQVQATATKVFGPTLGADGFVFLMEAALQYVHDLPATPLESTAEAENPTTPTPADSTSFGYRMAARLDYNNVFASTNLFPYVQFQQDLRGNSPQPVGQFLEGRSALTVGFRVDYLSRWEGNVSYTQYAGGKSELRDRDFITATLKYSF
jgi:hypothetical protein